MIDGTKRESGKAHSPGNSQGAERLHVGGWRNRLAILIPTRACKLLAHVDPLGEAALLAQHVAAPVEPAVAALAVRLFQDVVPAAAAQRAAAVCARAALVAYPSLRARRVHGRVALTEVRGLLKVHQLSGHAPTATAIQPPPAPTHAVSYARVENPTVLVLRVDENGRKELLLQQGAHETELRRHVPAGLKLAAPRRAMALALPLYVIGHYL